MNELDQLRAEADQLKNAIRVSNHLSAKLLLQTLIVKNMGPLPRVIPYFEGSFGKGKMIFESPHNSKTCPHNHIIILTSRIFSICCFINYTNVKCNRMEGRRPAIQLWLRLLVLWSQLVAFKCAPEGHLEAICPKYTPCTGAQNQGVFLVHLYHHLI